jgi:predicted ATPase
MVCLAGDAGIGKTTLIERFGAELGADVAIARGQCVQGDLGAAEPYLPILEALAGLCRLDDRMLQLMRRVAPAWLARMPWLIGVHEGHRAQRELTLGDDQMLLQLGELLERRPLLLVIEDMHWSDHATVQLMNHIARRRGRASLMWLASFRLVETVECDHPLRALRSELRLHGLCDEITLVPFSEQEIASYLAERAPSRAGDNEFVHALHERTGGLPVFVAHVVAELASGALADGNADAGPRLAVSVPESLDGIIDGYAARLSPEQRAVLEAAAICGATFRVTALAAVLSWEPDRVSSICEELVRGHLWLNAATQEPGCRPDTVYTFRHGLPRLWLGQRMGRLARRP